MELINEIIQNINTSNETWNGYYCPFCGHRKKKFSFNNETFVWHCWVCNTSGKSLTKLYYKLKLNNIDLLENIRAIDSSNNIIHIRNNSKQQIFLPKGFYNVSNINKKIFGKNIIINYLQSRNITINDIYRYNIGITNEPGNFENRLIIPSYDNNNNLNYYVARDYTNTEFLKYLNPKIEKRDNIIFENLLNFNYPITIVEGIFDAITIKRNATPLLGKILNKNSKLFNEILKHKTKINIFLDKDAFVSAIDIAELLFSYGINVNLVKSYKLPNNDDINDIGFVKSWKMIEESININRSSLFRLKIKFPKRNFNFKNN